MGKLIKIPIKLEQLDGAFKPKKPKFRYAQRNGNSWGWWLKIRTANGEEVASRCCNCPTGCHRYFEIPSSRVSDD